MINTCNFSFDIIRQDDQNVKVIVLAKVDGKTVLSITSLSPINDPDQALKQRIKEDIDHLFKTQFGA